jgi:hypothetical protein
MAFIFILCKVDFTQSKIFLSEINKNAKGIKFKARGNNETYEVHLTLKGVKMPPWSYLSSTFNVSENWQEFEISFSDFKKNGYMMASMMVEILM